MKYWSSVVGVSLLSTKGYAIVNGLLTQQNRREKSFSKLSLLGTRTGVWGAKGKHYSLLPICFVLASCL